MSGGAARIPELENKLAITAAELERISSHLTLKTDECRSLEKRVRTLEEELERCRRRYEELEVSMRRELKNQSGVFEQKISVIEGEN